MAPTGSSPSVIRYTNGSVIPPNVQPNTPLQNAFARSTSADGSSKCTMVAMGRSLPASIRSTDSRFEEAEMSVIMTLVVPGDPKAAERMAQENPERMETIMASAKAHGLIAHRFYGSEGKIMAIDEWPDAASFQAFFSEMEPEIGPMMQQAATGEPEITFWTKLETGDDYGWAA